MAARWAHNPEAAGSIPAPATIAHTGGSRMLWYVIALLVTLIFLKVFGLI